MSKINESFLIEWLKGSCGVCEKSLEKGNYWGLCKTRYGDHEGIFGITEVDLQKNI